MSFTAGYRGDGKRAWKAGSNGERTYFLYDGDQLLHVMNSSGTITSTLTWGANGLVSTRNGTGTSASTRFYTWDERGNGAQATDINGAVTRSTGFAAYGRAWTTPIDGFSGYGGQWGYIRDGETGFYLCTYRYYDTSRGRWLTRDPIRYAGGINLYGYVQNNPVAWRDPSGLWKWAEPSTWFDGNGYQGSGLQFDSNDIHAPGSIPRGLLTGDRYASDDVYNAALNGGGDAAPRGTASIGASGAGILGVGANVSVKCGVGWSPEKGFSGGLIFGGGVTAGYGANISGSAFAEFTNASNMADLTGQGWGTNTNFKTPIAGPTFGGGIVGGTGYKGVKGGIGLGAGIGLPTEASGETNASGGLIVDGNGIGWR